jgi:hypothetical protein
MSLKARKQKKERPAPESPIEWTRADPSALAAFDPSTKQCTMNCGPHGLDPRSRNERLFLCDDCLTVPKRAPVMPKIDVSTLRFGLEPVAAAQQELDEALRILRAGPADHEAACKAVDDARARFHDACGQLYGFISGVVVRAELDAQPAN